MNKRTLSITGLVCGILLALGPVWGLALTTWRMSHAFSVLGASGISDPKHLADDVGHSMMSAMLGFCLFPAGLLVIGVSLWFLLRKPTPPQLPEILPAKQP